MEDVLTATRRPLVGPWPGLARAAAVTVALLAAAWALQWVPLPGVDASVIGRVVSNRALTSIGALGITPLVTGFVLAELFSFSPPGRRWRHGGLAGRARLDRLALGIAVASAAVQASGIARTLETMTDPFELPAVAHPGAAFRLLIGVVLVAVTAALYALGSAIGRWGIGNGFCWLLALPISEALARQWRHDPRLAGAEPTEILFGALWIVPIAAVVIWLLLRGPAAAVATAAGDSLAPRLPALPQGALPVYGGEVAVALVFALPALAQSAWLSRSPLVVAVAGRALLIPALSLLAYVLFASRRRVAANLAPDATVPPATRRTIDRHWVITTAILTGGSIALLLVARFIPRSPMITLFALLVLAALALDLRDELSFTLRHGGSTRLLQLDNVHLASYLQTLLREQGVETMARAYRFRSLFYFLNPLVKIELRVPAASWDAAADVLETQEMRTP